MEHDPLSDRQIKGIQENADYIPMKRPALELCTFKRKVAAAAMVENVFFFC